MVKQVCDRLVQALNDDSPLSCASHLREDTLEHLRATKRRRVGPSARTELATMPFLPEVSATDEACPRTYSLTLVPST